MQTNTFHPESWLESTVRALKEYTETALDNSILDNSDDPVGLEIYKVVMEWPAADIEPEALPMPKTIIHFEIDSPNMEEQQLGFGTQTALVNYDEDLQTIRPQSAERSRINFDIGIWASARSGGTTARLRAYQVLNNIFHGAAAQLALRAATDGGDGYLEIDSFRGGAFATEKINDIDVYRMMGAELQICVYSRTPLPMVGIPTIEGVVVDSQLTIDV